MLASLLVAHQVSKARMPIDYVGQVKLKISAPMQIGKWKLQLVPTPRFEEPYGIRYIYDRLLYDGDECYARFSFRAKTIDDSLGGALGSEFGYLNAWTKNGWDVRLRLHAVGKPRNYILGSYTAMGKHLVVEGLLAYTADLDDATIKHLRKFIDDVTASLLPSAETQPFFGTTLN